MLLVIDAIVSSTWVATLGARFAVGSSNITTEGFRIRAIAMATICLSPPLRFEDFVARYFESWGKSSSGPSPVQG